MFGIEQREGLFERLDLGRVEAGEDAGGLPSRGGQGPGGRGWVSGRGGGEEGHGGYGEDWSRDWI